MKNNELPDKYITALRIPWLTSLYDPIVIWTTRESRVKGALIEQAGLDAKMKVLDLASGTGTLSLMIKQRFPCVDVEGIDGDPKILQIAQAKSDRVGLDVKFEQGLATQLPYADFSFDRVFSTLFFHHLDLDDKHLVFTEIYRVLKPGGRFFCLEFSKVQNTSLEILYNNFSKLSPSIGKLIVGDKEPYEYLIKSIENFINQDELIDLMKKHNFKKCFYRNLSGGIVSIHSGWKI